MTSRIVRLSTAWKLACAGSLGALLLAACGGDDLSGDVGSGGNGLGSGGLTGARDDGSGGDAASGAGGATGGGSATGGEGGYEGPWPPADTFANPVLWEDLADTEVIRVGDVFYYTASNMHYSPGAPILRSWDLVNWEYAGHAVPKLDYAAKYDLNGGRAYVKGTWASTLGYRESSQSFYFVACIEFGKTYVYTASAVEGPWTKSPAINNCYYDAGLLVDDDDTMYVAYGNTTISVAQLNAAGTGQVKAQQVFSTPGNIGTLEGSRFYKKDGYYYIFLTRPPNGQFIIRSTNPFGPYELHTVVDNIGAPVGGAGAPHQGALVQLQNGDWYYMAFIDAFPGGRVPVLAPVTWVDGWPVVEVVNNAWGASYPFPDVPKPPRATKSSLGVDTFDQAELSPEWEWNHNPDDSKWSAGDGLELQTATVTSDLFAARNTLTRRIRGPESTATIELDYSTMKDGDVAGLALFRNVSAWIGVKKAAGQTRVVTVGGLTLDSSWNTSGTGSENGSQNISGGKIWLRAHADIRPGSGRKGTFSYSTDGVTFMPLGSQLTLDNTWQFFMGYRFALFDYATASLGGSVRVESFEITAP